MYWAVLVDLFQSLLYFVLIVFFFKRDSDGGIHVVELVHGYIHESVSISNFYSMSCVLFAYPPSRGALMQKSCKNTKKNLITQLLEFIECGEGTHYVLMVGT